MSLGLLAILRVDGCWISSSGRTAPSNRIAGHFEMSRPAVSQHLRILLEAGLVLEQRHGRERRYRLVPARLAPVRDWLAHYEQFWDEHLQRLQKHLSQGE